MDAGMLLVRRNLLAFMAITRDTHQGERREEIGSGPPYVIFED
jgi:hypothetical protein